MVVCDGLVHVLQEILSRAMLEVLHYRQNSEYNDLACEFCTELIPCLLGFLLLIVCMINKDRRNQEAYKAEAQEKKMEEHPFYFELDPDFEAVRHLNLLLLLDSESDVVEGE